MFRELCSLAAGPLPAIATTMCFAIFVLVIAYLASDRRRGHHRAMEHLPLDDGTDRHV
jgi:hypothetical protein